MQDLIVTPEAKRSRTGQAQVLSYLKKFKAQDKLTVQQFCMKHKGNRTNFYAWQKRRGKRDEHSNPKGFVSIKVTSASASSPQAYRKLHHCLQK